MYRVFFALSLLMCLTGCPDHADSVRPDDDDSAGDDDDSAPGVPQDDDDSAGTPISDDDSAGDDDSAAGDDDDSAATTDDDDSTEPVPPPPCDPPGIPTLAGTCITNPFDGAHRWRLTLDAEVPDMVMGTIPWDDPVAGDPWAFLPDLIAVVYVGNVEVVRTDTVVDSTSITVTWEGPVDPMGFSVSIYEHDPGHDSAMANWSWAGPSTVRALLEAGGADAVEYTGNPVGVSVAWIEAVLVD